MARAGLKHLGLVLPLVLLAAPVLAQGKAETLADLRVELGQLAASFNTLKGELTTTGASARVGGGDALQRLDAIEAELSRLTGRAEEIELRLNRVVNDGTTRITDMEFRLCEVTEGCDPMTLGSTPALGGSTGGASGGSTAPAVAPSAPVATGPEMAMSEKADFDRAREVLGQGDFQGAAALLETYAQSYPGGPLIQEAHYLRGQALMSAGDVKNAGHAWVQAYSVNPQGERAPDALVRLGEALRSLGQTHEACLTFGQVAAEYPAAPAAGEARVAMQGLGCS